MIETIKLGEIKDVFVTDFVANGSFQSLKENVNEVDDGYAVMIRLVDFNKSWNIILSYAFALPPQTGPVLELVL